MAPMEQQPSIASLLLQLDLLVEPRKMSIYRLAIETLIEVLRRKDFPISQIMALDEFASLSQRLTASGNSLIEARLLQTAGLDQLYKVLMKAERL
ncbi:Ring-type e3 ubiquitin transferase, partial [Thalictrum thalictroides]